MNWKAWGVEVAIENARDVYLMISAEAAGDEPRAPVLVNLVLDRSGSMKGAPLSAAIEAAWNFVELARADDFIGLCLFDGVAEQRVPVQAMNQRGKDAIADALAGVHTGRGTALHQAVELAARSLQRVLVPGRRPRMLLLTDGEPSVGPDTQAAFDALGLTLAKDGISVHALGLARHYVAEVLAALTLPSGNAFEHVDGPEGLGEAMGAVVSRLFGEVGHAASVKLQPFGFSSLTPCHAYPTRVEGESMVVTLGDVSRGLARRVLLKGLVAAGGWQVTITGDCTERGDQRHQKVQLQRVGAETVEGRLMIALSHELELVSDETAAWLSLARRDLKRAEQQLVAAEAHLAHMAALQPASLPVSRHATRLSDLRLAIERGEGDIPLLIRRAKSAHAETHVSQVIPLIARR